MTRAWWPASAALALSAVIAPHASAQHITYFSAPPMPFKFSDVRSRQYADSLVGGGKLVKIYLFPTELGGEDDPANIAYVTPEAAERRAIVVGKVRRLLRDHLIDQFEVMPDFSGTSIVPTRIRFKAWHTSGPTRFEEEVEVWQ